MKKHFYSLVLVLILQFSFLILNSYGQWGSDVRLTNNPGNSFKSDNIRSMAANGSVLHVVWCDDRDGYSQVYYKRSLDGGTTWGADVHLVNYTSFSTNPTVALSGFFVHVLWQDGRDGNGEIYYKRSTDGGTTWGADTRMTNAFSYSGNSSIAVSGSLINIVWQDSRDGNHEIYSKRSTDDGTTWGADTRLTNNAANSLCPSAAVSGLLIAIVWQDSRDGNNEIYYKRSTDGGLTWEADTRLTSNASESYYSSVAVSGSLVNVVWTDERDGNQEIYFKRSTDGGTSWGTDTRLTNNIEISDYPSIAISGSEASIVWHDNRDGNQEIYYNKTTDGGISWGAEIRLTNNIANSSIPTVAVTGSQVHCVWQDNRDGNYEIYYKRTIPVPVTPLLISPANNSTGNLLSLNLVWTKTQYSTKYRVLLATDSLFNNVILNDSLLTDSVKSLTNLSTLTNYYWKVSAGNIVGWSNYSSTYRFRTIGSPTQVNLFSPANYAVNQPVNITLKWYKAIDQTLKSNKAVSNYWVEYSTDSSFIIGVVKDSTLTDSLKSVSVLSLGNKYYWRVKAKNAAGWGSFSSIWNFTTVPPTPAAPVLVSPLNNVTNLQLNVLLDWSIVSFAVTYRIQIATDSLFTSIVFDTSNVSRDSLRLRSGILILNTKYFWRVNATNITGTGLWSTVWNFRTSSVGINIFGNVIPDEFKLYNNYPNPFNPVTKIKFDVASVGDVKMVVYDIMGREVQTLVNERLHPGTYEATFDGSQLTSGVYFYKIQAGDFMDTKRMLMIK